MAGLSVCLDGAEMEGWVVGDAFEFDDFVLVGVGVVDAERSVPELAGKMLALLKIINWVGGLYPT